MLLIAQRDPSAEKRRWAEEQLNAALQSNRPQYLATLAHELRQDDKPAESRMLAGLILKNELRSENDAAKDKQLKKQWFAIDDAGRAQIKSLALETVIRSQNHQARKTAAQVVSAVAVAELPLNRWPELLPALLAAVQPPSDSACKAAALLSLGYLCEEVDGREITLPEDQTNLVLTALVLGMREVDISVKLEATRALCFALPLAQAIFERDNDRNVIMSIVTDTVKLGGLAGVAALECLVKVASEYTNFLQPYMTVLTPLTLEIIQAAQRKEVQQLAMYAIEFWSTLCDTEMWLMEEKFEQYDLVKSALPMLLPVLTNTLTIDDIGGDDDDAEETWNCAMAAGTCLSLVAQSTGDACVEGVLTFVNANFGNSNPRMREAAILAFGSIMMGPSSYKLAPFVVTSFPFIVRNLEDASVAVRDTTAWTIGKICHFHARALEPTIAELLPILATKLATDKPRVAANVAWVFDVLAQEKISVVYQYFADVVKALLTAAARPDASSKNLRGAAYSAVSSMVTSADEKTPLLPPLLADLSERLGQSLLQPSHGDRDCETQGLLCGCLQTLTQKLAGQPEVIEAVAERLMILYIRVFALYQQQQESNTAVHEDALLAVTALIRALKAKFSHFMPQVQPLLVVALQNPRVSTACSMAVGAVGDLARALDVGILVACDDFIRCFVQIVQRADVDKSLKPAVIICLGDLALASKAGFVTYLAGVVGLLQEASRIRVEDGPVDSAEWVDYVNELRRSVLEAYTGIVHGLREGNELPRFRDYVNVVLDLVSTVLDDVTCSNETQRMAVTLVGDLVIAFQGDLAKHLKSLPLMVRIDTWVMQMRDLEDLEAGRWLQKTVRKYAN